jgi:alkylation response protein AidB-like acyl-CoA dehydrogenase
LGVAGQDASEQFWQFHNKAVLKKYEKRLRIGSVQGKAKKEAPKAESTGQQAKREEAAQKQVKQVKPQQQQQKAELYGELVPYGDPAAYQGWHSPYYNDSHRKFRNALREWVDAEITPYCMEWDEKKKMPQDIWKRCADAGILPAFAAKKWYKEYAGDKIAGGISVDEFDAFHELIAIDEMSRCGSGGVGTYLYTTLLFSALGSHLQYSAVSYVPC